MEEVINKLINLGLTQTQAKVYIFLLQHKQAKAGIICSKQKIPRSHIYDLLEKLLEKGLISFKIENNVKIYRPVNPESLFSIIKEKERELEKEKQELKEFISSLKTIDLKENKENDFKYFKGINGVRSMFNEFAESWKPNSEVYVASAPIAYEKWNAFLLEYFHKPRIKKKVNQRLIIPKTIKEFGKQREKLKYLKIKYSDIVQETEFGVSENYVYFLSEGEEPYALLIKDENFAKTQIKIFNELWKTSKP
jgi:HTH-type transcriptional regulator, sugar sensing transcriptional regulator